MVSSLVFGLLLAVATVAYVYLAWRFKVLINLLNISIAKKAALQAALEESMEKETLLQESLDHALITRKTLLECVSHAATPEQKMQCLLTWMEDVQNDRS